MRLVFHMGCEELGDCLGFFFVKFVGFTDGDVQKSDLEGLVAIWRRLRAEVERKQASPAMRLLDELLMIVSPFDELADDMEEERCRDHFSTC